MGYYYRIFSSDCSCKCEGLFLRMKKLFRKIQMNNFMLIFIYFSFKIIVFESKRQKEKLKEINDVESFIDCFAYWHLL